MSLDELKNKENAIFTAIEKACHAIGCDFYVIGKRATNVWYARGGMVSLQTKDIDFAVMIGSKGHYESIRKYLQEKENFLPATTNSFAMIAPEGIQIDILPFGEIEIDDSVAFGSNGLSRINVNGFREVNEAGTEDADMGTGHEFRVATLPAIILLKLIAYDDRPERRSKDARDVADILVHFFDLKADLVYDKHVDLFGAGMDDAITLPEISAIVVGREIRDIIRENRPLGERVVKILQGHILAAGDSSFVANMAAENGSTVEENTKLLQNLLMGFTGGMET